MGVGVWAGTGGVGADGGAGSGGGACRPVGVVEEDGRAVGVGAEDWNWGAAAESAASKSMLRKMKKKELRPQRMKGGGGLT